MIGGMITALILAASVLSGHVDRVIDGDTLVLQGQPVRLWGVNAPERRQPGGAAAKAALEALTAGQTIYCLWWGDRSWQRLVALCAAGGRDLGLSLINSGHATRAPRFDRGFYLGAAAQK